MAVTNTGGILIELLNDKLVDGDNRSSSSNIFKYLQENLLPIK